MEDLVEVVLEVVDLAVAEEDAEAEAAVAADFKKEKL